MQNFPHLFNEELKTAKSSLNEFVPQQQEISEELRAFIDKEYRSVDPKFMGDRNTLLKNGFTIKQSDTKDFGHAFLKLYQNDANVLVTTDSILHAWQCSFGKILEEIEKGVCVKKLKIILTNCLKKIPKLKINNKYSKKEEYIKDLTMYFQIALRLLNEAPKNAQSKEEKYFFREFYKKKAEKPKKPSVVMKKSSLEDEIISNIFAAENKSAELTKIKLFGEDITIDYSQFIPRGHYAKDKTLKAYFYSMSWLGKVLFTIEKENIQTVFPILLLYEILNLSKSIEIWNEIEMILQSFMGKSDNINVNELNKFFSFHNIEISNLLKSISSDNDESIKDIHSKILDDKEFLTKQQYTSMPLETNDFHTPTDCIPMFFGFFGQRFGYDSWAMSQFVYDKIKNKETNTLEFRKLSSTVDVAYSIFENDFTSNIIQNRIQSKDKSLCNELPSFSYTQRDGFDYTSNLTAVRNITENLSDDFWNLSFYSNWLYVLRSLSSSNDPLEKFYPEVMKTNEYQKKNLNTQLASYSILKYESVLYIKPPVPVLCGCNTPKGYVEPKVIFWLQFIKHIEQILSCLSSFQSKNDNILSFLKHFLATLETLKNISIKELNHEMLNDKESSWLQKVVEGIMGGSGIGSQTGWYYDLFYSCYTFKKHNVISDIMTDYPDPALGTDGGVLHSGVFGVDYLCMAIDHVGVQSSHDIPGSNLSLMQRKYKDGSYSQYCGFGFMDDSDPEIVTLPPHTTTNKRVKAWEDLPPPLSDDGSFTDASLQLKSYPKPSPESTAFFIGPVFRYYEFITPVSQRVTKKAWNEGFYEKVHRPEWFSVQ